MACMPKEGLSVTDSTALNTARTVSTLTEKETQGNPDAPTPRVTRRRLDAPSDSKDHPLTCCTGNASTLMRMPAVSVKVNTSADALVAGSADAVPKNTVPLWHGWLVFAVKQHVDGGSANTAQGISRPSALKSTKTCDFTPTPVRGGGFALDHSLHAGPPQKYMGNMMACMLTFV